MVPEPRLEDPGAEHQRRLHLGDEGGEHEPGEGGPPRRVHGSTCEAQHGNVAGHGPWDHNKRALRAPEGRR